MSEVVLFNLEPVTYKVSDFLTWNRNKKLILSPDFQRRLVWTDNYKSYLIDTIIRGLPIPIIIIRDKLVSLDDYEPEREVVDWQQRLTTLFSYIINQDFKLKKIHNPEYGNSYFKDLPSEIQQRILNYKFSIYELPSSVTDAQVLEIFSRLNSTWYKLNKQELRNAEYSGEFKNTIYSVSASFIDMFLSWDLFTLSEISRMKEVELTTDLFIYMIDWLKARKPELFDSYYEKYDDDFPNADDYKVKYSYVLNSINELIWEELPSTIFSKDSMFYHLFAVFYTYLFWTQPKSKIPSWWKNKLLTISENIKNDNIDASLVKAFSQWTNNIDARKLKDEYLTTILYASEKN